jgi:transcriptional regulator with XRE-family HTH domain
MKNKKALYQLGQKLREARLDAGYNIQELGKLVGLHGATINRIENAQIRLNLDNLLAITKATGANLSAILEEIEFDEQKNNDNPDHALDHGVLRLIRSNNPGN